MPSNTSTTASPIPGAGHNYIGEPFENVNPADGSLTFRLPVSMPTGRSITLPFSIAYDSHTAWPSITGQGGWTNIHTYALTSKDGWSDTVPLASFQELNWQTADDVNQGKMWSCYANINFVFQDANGDRHDLGLTNSNTSTRTQCGDHSWDWPDGFSNDVVTDGGEGPIAASIPSLWTSSPSLTVTDADGTSFSFNSFNELGIVSTITDRNGNFINVNWAGANAPFTYTDTLARTVLQDSGFAVNPEMITVSGFGGPYTSNWGTEAATPLLPIPFTSPVSSGTCGQPDRPSDSIAGITAITLPNGQTYTFSYDSSYGLLNKVTYASGGYVRYVWGWNYQAAYKSIIGSNSPVCDMYYAVPAVIDRYVSFNGAAEVLHQHFSYSTSWNAGSSTWSTKQTTVTTYDLVRNTNFQTVYTYSPLYADHPPNTPPPNDQMPVEETIASYGTDGSILKTVTKTWSNIRLLSTAQTSYPNGQATKTAWSYDSNEMESERYDYDFGSGGPGALLRKMATSYATFSNHVVDKPSGVITYDGSTNRTAETDYYYDQVTPTATSGVVQHTTSCNCGNLTTKAVWTNSGGTTVNTTYTYDDTGQLLSVTDPCGNTACSDMTGTNHTTAYSYSDSFAAGTGTPPGQTNAYVTQVTYPNTGVAHVETYTWGYNDGLVRSHTDQNSQPTTYTYADVMLRTTQINYPDGGQTCYAYNDTSPAPTVTTTTKLNSTQLEISVTIADGLGHVTQTQLTSDPEGTDYTDATYDGTGAVRTRSNPHRPGSSATDGTWNFYYDALGRSCLVVPPDGSTPQSVTCPTGTPAGDVFTTYAGNCTTVTDQVGKSRKSCIDGLGQLTKVFEDPAGANYETDYQYDTNSNLKRVDQKGTAPGDSSQWRTRTFTYDMMSRLICAANPEIGGAVTCPSPDNGSYTPGTIRYSYDQNGNVSTRIASAPNQTGGATVTTAYTYDQLNRLTYQAYSGIAASPVKYYWDLTQQWGVTMENPIGRLTFVGPTSGQNSNIISYDPMGRIKQYWDCIDVYCKHATYAYDSAGELTSITYPSGRVVNNTYSSAGRPIIVSEPARSLNYVSGSTAQFGVSYSPHGAVSGMYLGQTSSSIPITFQETFNNRLQPVFLTAQNASGYVMNRAYSFSLGAGDNGNVTSISNNVDHTRDVLYTYDALNRVEYAESPTNAWGNAYTYDAWGNMQVGPEANKQTSTENFQHASDGNNRVADFTYDAAGNLTNDGGSNTYSYDAENRLSGVGGASYDYDYLGRRVKAGNTGNDRMYWYGAFGEVLAESDLNANLQREYIYFNGTRVARVDVPSGATYYFLRDRLGSTSLLLDSSGTVQNESDFYPFGTEHIILNEVPNERYRFTGKERDTETGLDYFNARHYGSNMGRFIQADPLYIEMHRLADPQLLNLYSYVRNNPLSLTDPSGMLVDVNCQRVSQQQCAQTVTDFNNRDGAQFQVSRDDKTGQLNVLDPQNVDPTKLSSGERALYDAITNKDATGTLTVVGNDSSFDFEKSTGKGANSLDRSDLNALNGADKRLSGEVMAHAAIESYDSAKPGVSVDQAHDLAAGFFGFRYGLFTPNWGTTVSSLSLNWRAMRLHENFRVNMKLVTPIPRATFNQMQRGGGAPPARDVTSVEIVPNK